MLLNVPRFAPSANSYVIPSRGFKTARSAFVLSRWLERVSSGWPSEAAMAKLVRTEEFGVPTSYSSMADVFEQRLPEF